MTSEVPLDVAWLRSHPLPIPKAGSDKNGRGRVLLVGGARFVPGALALTGEAALRAGAGKLQMATVEAVASALGVLVPEAAMVALPMREDGEIACKAVERLTALVPRCDLLLVGPGMSATAETGELVAGLFDLSPAAMLLDAAALTCASIAAYPHAPFW
jgi:NAD(P)H-hydrate repair Nnr-like enzyme with NAD(P)H-hydrate dehydratase domain